MEKGKNLNRHTLFKDQKIEHSKEVISKLINNFNTIPIKIPARIFIDIGKIMLKFIQEGEGIRSAETILKKNNEVGRTNLLNFKIYYVAAIIKTCGTDGEIRQKDQGNRIENSRTDPHKHNQLIFDKRAKAIQWKKNSLFNKCCWLDTYGEGKKKRKNERKRKERNHSNQTSHLIQKSTQNGLQI